MHNSPKSGKCLPVHVMLFSGDKRSFCIIGDALRTIGIDIALYIEENRIPSRFCSSRYSPWMGGPLALTRPDSRVECQMHGIWGISCGCISLSGHLLGPFRSVYHHFCNRAQLSEKTPFHSQIWRLRAPNQPKSSPNRQNRNFRPPESTKTMTVAKVLPTPTKGT